MTVWDCFLFNNELRLLEFRLDLLSRLVDKVLIVEAPATFRGEAKPLQYLDNAVRFQRHSDRIMHVPVEGLHDRALSTWDRERLQHAAIRAALGTAGVADNDLVIVGDVDEVPSEDEIRHLANELPLRPTRIVLRHALYFANWELPAAWCDGPMAARGKDLDHPDLGVLLGDPSAVWGTTTEPKTEPSGWHLSYLGGPPAVVQKHEQLSDTSWDNRRDKKPSHVERLLKNGVDLGGRHTLRRIGYDELDAVQRQLHALAPEVFDFSPAPSVADSYRAYTRIRRRLPGRAADAADRLVVPLLPVLGPVALSVERARDRRRATTSATGGRPLLRRPNGRRS